MVSQSSVFKFFNKIRFDLVFKQFPMYYKESLNAVLLQEVIKYNILLNIMKTSITMTGKIIMDEDQSLFLQ